MDKSCILTQITIARNLAEQGDVDILAQHLIITALENRGLDTASAEALFTKLICSQDAHMANMEAFLDEMDKPERLQA